MSPSTIDFNLGKSPATITLSQGALVLDNVAQSITIDGPGATLLTISGGDTSHNPVVYFDTDDIDASIAKVKELGGSAEEKMPVPGMGWFVACKDDQGTAFSLWQADDNAPTPEGMGT